MTNVDCFYDQVNEAMPLILPDRGDRYLSTDCFTCENLECVYKDFIKSLSQKSQ